MPFDQPTRNRLARFVGDARSLLTEEFRRQLQHEYGLDPASGDVADLGKLAHLDDARRETARILRATLAHYLAGASNPGKAGPDKRARQEALQRIVREQAYTVLNRLAALRMAEARGLLIECVARGYQSQGFQLYAHLAGPALGETGAAYRGFLFSLFDELAVELPALFDRFSPQGRLFPREAALLRLLDLLDAPDLAPLWGEDETLGWIYQYFNSGEERRQMRAESQAPRDSRELAVRNQFFTPRYVVEFLTDNTLGRIWYEMTEGRTALTESCRYLVRRPLEIFLPEAGFEGDIYAFKAHDLIFDQGWRALPVDLDWPAILELGLAVDGYTMEEQLRGRVAGFTSAGELAGERVREYRQTGAWRGNSLELWLCLSFAQRALNNAEVAPDEEMLLTLQTLYQAWRAALEREAAESDQAALLNQPVYIRPRPLKDPRQITMLDPACGSMHFGLYAFDLFERIYEEAWDLQASKRWPVNSDRSPDHASRFTLHASLLDDYPTKEALLRDLPRLIVEHNLHGIDIDPRAVQIAGLSLWLRAQRSWQAQGLRPGERPTIRRSHIVCAEPMPGEQALLEEFLSGLREDRLEGLIRRVLEIPATQQVRATARMAEALCDLVRLVWQEMRLAGEAGSLLKIEETLAAAIAAAEAEWSERWPLFRVVDFGLSGEAERVRYPRGLPSEDGADFWPRAEALVLAALQGYAEQAQNGAGYQRRMFASDAARGFAFVDLCRKRYDVLLMNPPFGKPSRASRGVIDASYENSKNDLYAAFVERIGTLTSEAGNWGAITTRSAFFAPHFLPWREHVLEPEISLATFADLGRGVLDDATNEVAAYTGSYTKKTDHCVFVRALTAEDKDNLLISAIIGLTSGVFTDKLHLRLLSTFWELDFKTFAYWIMPSTLKKLSQLPRLDPSWAIARQGIATTDDFRFIRVLWEVPYEEIIAFSDLNNNIDGYIEQDLSKIKTIIFGKRWAFHVKSSASQPWYAPLLCFIDWKYEGKAIKIARKGKNQHEAPSEELYFRPGFSWTRRAVRITPHVIPFGAIPSASRYMGFPKPKDLFVSLGILASNVASSYARISGEKFEWPNFLVEMIKSIPVPMSVPLDFGHLEDIVRHHVSERRQFYSRHEPFHEFARPLNNYEAAHDSYDLSFSFSSILGDDIDRMISEKYGLTPEEYGLLSMDLLEAVSNVRSDSSDGETDDEDVIEITERSVRQDQLSYAVGVVYGRWDVRFSRGEKHLPDPVTPLAPLPACPPGMLQNAHGLPAAPADVPADYPLRISWPGILVDDPGHAEDIEARLREALRVIWPESADAIEQEACQILGVGSLREYFAAPNRFFDDHLKRYSKSRRVAPIYWPLSTPSGSYTLWLYYHRLNDQILYSCVNDFLEPKLAEVRDQRLERQRRSGRSAREEKELEQLVDLEAELVDFRRELLRLAAFWRPNLNDGAQITAAPLWRLFRHRGWAKRLQETWEQLEAGDYDWAHLALSVWPARVAPKCVDDRSLAIAHDLEDLFWVEDDGGWRNLAAPEEEVETQKARRRSPARQRLRELLGELARGRARGLRCAEVWDELAAGQWDDLEASLLLWPERMAAKCWDDPLLAVTLQVTLPPKPTKAARERFIKEQVAAGCPDLAAALEEALAGRPDRFASFWAELARGDHDDLPLALALWPDRVVDTCAADAELAARHDVRRFLWVQGVGGLWRRRKAIKQEIADEVARRQGSQGG